MKHRTHLPNRFLMMLPEENLILAVIKRAWCDAFLDITAEEYYGLHQRHEQKRARQMFEDGSRSEWRKSLKILCSVIHMDDNHLVAVYEKYDRALKKGKTNIKPDEAFDILIKTLL